VPVAWILAAPARPRRLASAWSKAHGEGRGKALGVSLVKGPRRRPGQGAWRRPGQRPTAKAGARRLVPMAWNLPGRTRPRALGAGGPKPPRTNPPKGAWCRWPVTSLDERAQGAWRRPGQRPTAKARPRRLVPMARNLPGRTRPRALGVGLVKGPRRRPGQGAWCRWPGTSLDEPAQGRLASAWSKAHGEGQAKGAWCRWPGTSPDEPAQGAWRRPGQRPTAKAGARRLVPVAWNLPGRTRPRRLVPVAWNLPGRTRPRALGVGLVKGPRRRSGQGAWCRWPGSRPHRPGQGAWCRWPGTSPDERAQGAWRRPGQRPTAKARPRRLASVAWNIPGRTRPRALGVGPVEGPRTRPRRFVSSRFISFRPVLLI